MVQRHAHHGCIHCGDALPTSARFCPTCGEPVDDASSQSSHPQQQQQHLSYQDNKNGKTTGVYNGIEAIQSSRDSSAKGKSSYTIKGNESKDNSKEDDEEEST